MRKNLFYACLSWLVISGAQANSTVTPFFTSHSFSNIIPVKQLIEDDWQQAPNKNASKAFTQNELGIRTDIDNFSISLSHRYDYFVETNDDTAEAFYLDRQKKALDTRQQYNIDLTLLHQRSNGIRLGYKTTFDNFTTEFRLGYWQLNASRESKLSGIVASDLNGNIAADAILEEYYSANNFLKRQNNNDWDTTGSGITLDLHMQWQAAENLNITADLTDIYSNFQLKDSGFSDGIIDTDGTFINSIGGVAYLPLYRGREITADHKFELPKTVNIGATYTYNDLDYIAHFTRQGNVNFYYLGAQFKSDLGNTRLLLDIENTAPEIHFTTQWLSAYFAIDDFNINDAMLLKLGLNVHFSF